jgi:outer membrane lipoprotein-sorting protein
MGRMFRALAILLLAAGTLLLPRSGDALTLTSQDREDIARVEAYLSGLTTLKSRFLQASTQDYVARGTVYLRRPGRMRFEYDPPAQILMVADGTWLAYIDRELEQVSHIPLSSTPLAVLVDESVHLTDRLEILEIERDSGTIRFTLRMRSDPDAGLVRLVFSDQPMELKQWTIRDAQGIEVRIALLNPTQGVPLNDSLFKVDIPAFKPRGDGGR